MNTLKKILADMRGSIFGKRGLSFWFMVASFVFIVITLIVYGATGVTSYSPSLSSKVIALWVISVILAVLFSVCEIKVGKYVTYLLALWAWLEYLITQAPYLSSILVAIDNVSLSSGFLMTTIFGLLAWASALVSAIVQKMEIGSVTPKLEVVKAEE